MVGGPVAVAVLLGWLGHRGWGASSETFVQTSWILIWAAGLLGVHLLPLRPLSRALVSLIYTPLAVALIFFGLMTAACSWYVTCK